MESIMNNVKFSYEELLEQNKSLSAELAQCQTDKDFVWNLWKDLQTEKPDVTNAISQVVEREQQKSNEKDLKVLNLLKQKDDQIQHLQEISADHQAQLKVSNERLSGLLIEQSMWNEHRDEQEQLQKKLTTELETKDEMLNVHAQKELEFLHKITVSEQKLTERVEEKIEFQSIRDEYELIQKQLKNENIEIKQKLNDVEKTIEKQNNEIENNKKCTSDVETLNTCIKDLSEKLEETCSKLSEAERELEVRNEEYEKLNAVIKQQEKTIEQLPCDLLTCRDQLFEHEKCGKHLKEQSELIQNLQALQDETQQVLSNQQLAHREETQSLQKAVANITKKLAKKQKSSTKMETNYKAEVDSLKEQLNSKCSLLLTDHKEVNKDCSSCLGYQQQLKTLRNDYKTIKTSYEKKCVQLRMLNEYFTKNVNDLNDSIHEIESDSSLQHLKMQAITMKKQKDLLSAIDNELTITRCAHKQRFDRFKQLQKNYDLLIKQLATYETYESPTREKTSVNLSCTCDKTLQQENIKGLLSELEDYKKKYEVLNKERPVMEEELDELRVQSARDQTRLNELKLKLLQMRNAIRVKEDENTEEVEVVLEEYSSEDVLKQQIYSLEEKIHECEQEKTELQHNYKKTLEKNRNLLMEIESYKDELKTQKPPSKTTAHTQTIVDLSYGYRLVDKLKNEYEVIDKLNDIVDAIHDGRLTLFQLEQFMQSLEKRFHVTSSSQTSPNRNNSRKLHLVNSNTQTDVTSDSSLDGNMEKQRYQRKKSKLNQEHERLLLMKSELNQENKSLKKRVFSLEAQVRQLRESKILIRKQASDQLDDNENLKLELVENLQKLQVLRQTLQERTFELETLSKEVKLLSVQRDEVISEKKKSSKDLKLMETKFNDTSLQLSRITLQNKTLIGENEMLNLRTKESQEKISSLNKRLEERKTYCSELKLKNEELKKQVEQNIEQEGELQKKLHTAIDRDSRNKTLVQNLKLKNEELFTIKSKLQQDLLHVNTCLENKSKLLHDSNLLCEQADKAINDMEKAAYEQLTNQQQTHEDKYMILKHRYEKVTGKINEMKIALKTFFEDLLSSIHEKRHHINEIYTEKKKSRKREYLTNQAELVAKSILNMSLGDLHDFLDDGDSNCVMIPEYDENDIREKFDVILKKEAKFGNVLSKFLTDVVKYSEKLISYAASLSSDPQKDDFL